MANDETGSTSNEVPVVTGSRTAVAQAALEEAQEAARGARQRMDAAAQAVTDAEERVRLGDEAVTYEQLAGARHRLEVTTFATEREEGRALQAREALNLAEAWDIAAQWSEHAPRLRRAIRDAATALVQADQNLYQAVTKHNDAVAAAQRRIRQLHAPVLSAEPMAPLAFLHLKGLVSSESRQEISMAASLLPSDVVPAELLELVHGRAFARQTVAGNGGPLSPANGLRAPISTLTEQAQEESIRAPRSRVKRSPFHRSSEEV